MKYLEARALTEEAEAATVAEQKAQPGPSHNKLRTPAAEQKRPAGKRTRRRKASSPSPTEAPAPAPESAPAAPKPEPDPSVLTTDDDREEEGEATGEGQQGDHDGAVEGDPGDAE